MSFENTSETSDRECDEQKEFKSRGYQDEILRTCIERNTIVYLPTGAGKTYIAIMALKHFAKDLGKPISEGGKRSVFLTNTVALAHQQKEEISKRIPFNVQVYTGDMNVDAWTGERWLNEFEQNHVLIATVQIVLDIVRHGHLKISDFNLIVFDECHNAHKDHPMLLLMAKFKEYPETDHPRVIGLTGMLTTKSIKPGNVMNNLKKLEATFRATITTAKGAAYSDVLMYSTCPNESILEYEKRMTLHFEKIIGMIRSMIQMIEKWPFDITPGLMYDPLKDKQPTNMSKYEKICTELIYQINNLGLYGGTLANLAAIVDMELKKREAIKSNNRYLSRALITSLETILHIMERKIYNNKVEQMTQTDDEFDEQTISDDPATILNNSSSQVQKLLSCLTKFAEENSNEPMKGLIFVDRRSSARILCHVIKRYANALPHLKIKVEFMTGRNATLDAIEMQMKGKNNKRVLDRFKTGEINLIIATKVLEEGIDLQECNLVICYDTPTTFRSYMQRKGRARMRKSQFVIMTPSEGTDKLQKNIGEWQEINQILKKYLVEKAIDRPPPMQSDIDRATEQKYYEEYKTAKGAIADFNSAISTLNNYCMTLASDKFIEQFVEWEENWDSCGLSGTILMPILCPIKEKISGKPMPNTKLAKRSAAFEAVKRLHIVGELSDHLEPITQNICLEKYKDIYFKTWNQFEEDEPKKAGTRKHYRMHDIQRPAALIDSIPRINVQLYLYEIAMEPKFKGSDENIRTFHNLFQSPHTYGILTMKKLPRMGPIKCYQSFGEITCSISYEPMPIILHDPQELARLKRFHCILFKYILEIWKEYFVYDEKDSVIIVPTMNQKINWQIVKEFQTWSKVKEKTLAERTNAEYKRENWDGCVISKWYLNQTKKYVITNVFEEKSPLSSFPNDDYKNYAEYMLKTYPKTDGVVNNDQFLIGVKAITSRLNHLRPESGSSSERPELLIPEMCHNFRYPGDLWLKAILLPSIIHRITYILHAENIRNAINKYVGLDISDEPCPLIESIQNSDAPREKGEIRVVAEKLNTNDADTSILRSEDFEPIDLERHFDNVYEVDIDFYYMFKHGLSFDENKNGTNNSLLSPHHLHTNVPALCDVESDKLRINVLQTKLKTSITRGVEQHDILAAITTASSADVFNMESLEVLGDAFLKFSVSLYLIQRHPQWHEGFLTSIKGQIVGNRNLCYSAIRNKFSGMIKAHDFSPKDDWQPPMLKVDDQIQNAMREYDITPDILYKLSLSTAELEGGEVSNSSLEQFIQQFLYERNTGGETSTKQHFLGKQRISDKTCADCIEAILGACVKSIGVERTFKVLEMFEILPRNDVQDITKMLQNKLRSPRLRANIPDKEVDDLLTNHKKLEESIGYTFRDRAYLLQALTHPSYPTNRVTGCYQQLEFLGDAVLDFLITAYIFERCPHMDPGKLTDLRSALVNNVTLACLCVRYNIHLHILSRSVILSGAINRFVDFQDKTNYQTADHVELLMEEGECNMADYVDVPKTLGDVFESVIGAIFLDSGMDLETTWMFIYRLMEKELHEFTANVPIQTVRQLYEYPDAKPEFEKPQINKESNNVLVSVCFNCNGKKVVKHGFGTNKKNAKRAAAKLALSTLDQI
ncbi:endoribonuclease dcr-1-like [Contarinia nasturtii]|uniref:endoribonuclease dcr-1-like n=1 Tax=Contarinia nasturtii TaxID=265458 RepID=UPI0012D3F7AD|nr:endoribonuclease dcr-1-like [Contarinia nasturtii]